MRERSDLQGRRAARFTWLPELDRLLCVGIKHGGSVKHDAIDKVLKLVPELTRGDCWRRIRYLRRTPELPALHTQANDSPTRLQDDVAKRAPLRRWTATEDDRLMDWAGYETVAVIAKRLKRSERAIRFRLGALGVSARVTDGWSLRSLRKMLRVSPSTLRRFIGTGALRVKDPRVSASSVAAFLETRGDLLNSAVVTRNAVTLGQRDEGYTAERTAELLGTSVMQVQEWLCAGRLKVLNTFVTDRSFQDFCRQHGQEFNLELMEPGMRKWLVKEYGVSEAAKSPQTVPRSKKHALVTRSCRCGRKVTGNAYFRHAKVCQVVVGSAVSARSQAA
jgi:hypothetical protein